MVVGFRVRAAQIEHARIGLHLPEIRIDRRIKGDVGGQPQLAGDADPEEAEGPGVTYVAAAIPGQSWVYRIDYGERPRREVRNLAARDPLQPRRPVGIQHALFEGGTRQAAIAGRAQQVTQGRHFGG